MQRRLILPFLLFASFTSFSQFSIETNVVYGGNGADEAKDIAFNPANTFLFFGGRSFSTDGDVPDNEGGSDFWIMKRLIDGSLVWSKNYGGNSNDDLVRVMPHTDGGTLAFGTTHTSQGQFGTINGSAGGWLIRTNSSGNLITGKIFGGQISEVAVDAVRTPAGDVTMLMQAGSTTLNGQTNHGLLDVWVVHVNNNFDIQWSNLFGGNLSDIPVAMFRDINSNIYVVAQSQSDLPGLNPNKGEYDTWVFKLAPDGQMLWQKSFGGTDDDIPDDIVVHPDGFVYVTLQSLSEDQDFPINDGINDLWLLKLDSQDGDLITKVHYGGTGNDLNGQIDLYEDDKLVMSASSTSSNGDLTGNKGLTDVWVVTMDLDGNILQQMNYGGSNHDVVADLISKDSLFHLLNSTLSNDKNVPPNSTAQQDFWYFTLNTDPDSCSTQFTCQSDTAQTNILYPPDNNSLVCVTGCIEGLGPGPDFFNTICADFLNPTAYFKVETDTLADLLTISVTSEEFNEPRIAIFKTNNCISYTEVSCATGAQGNVLMQYIDVEPLTTYVIAISDQAGNIGEFEFCASSVNVEFCNESDIFYVTNTSMGSLPTGPYQPGEEVTFCYELLDWNKIDCNGFQGLMPTFGPGWDSTSFDLFGMPIEMEELLAPIETGFWDWYAVGEVHYNISNPINGYQGGQGLPAGWYFTNTGDPPPNDHPDLTTGDNNSCLPTPSDRWKVCFTLKVVDDCETNLDASVTMKTFSDGEIGSRLSLGCAYDQPEVFNAIMRCCLNPGIQNIQDFSICSGDTISFTPETNLMEPVSFTWTATPDPFVTGAANGFRLPFFYQVLNSTVVIPMQVDYSIRAESNGCETETDEFTVTIFQQPSAQLSSTGPLTVCGGSTVNLNIQLLGDPPFAIGLYRDNEFFANILSETNQISIDIDPVFSSVLSIGELSDANCEGSGSGTVVVNVQPVTTSLLDTSICAGESIIIGGTTLNEAGSYSILLEEQNVNGCDSMVNVTLGVISSITDVINEVICNGDTLFVLGLPFTESTIQTIEYLGPEGCPNYIELTLVVKDTFYTEISQTICAGDTLEFGGVKVFEEGDYSHTDEIEPGCFETTTLHLDVLPAIVVNDVEIIADDGNNNGAVIVEISGGTTPFSFKWSSGQLTESIFNIPDGHYTLTVTDALGCSNTFEFEVPFINATGEIDDNQKLTCRPTLLSTGDPIRLVNLGRETEFINHLELTNIHGQVLSREGRFEITGESYHFHAAPMVTPGVYLLQVTLKNKNQLRWKIVVE